MIDCARGYRGEAVHRQDHPARMPLLLLGRALLVGADQPLKINARCRADPLALISVPERQPAVALPIPPRTHGQFAGARGLGDVAPPEGLSDRGETSAEGPEVGLPSVLRRFGHERTLPTPGDIRQHEARARRLTQVTGTT
jgi:hypothetical protein